MKNKNSKNIISLGLHDKGWTIGAFIDLIKDLLYVITSKLGKIPFFQKIGKILSFIPNKLSNNISYRKRQVLWGVVFVLPLMIGLVYFFLIPFIMTINYSFSNVYNEVAKGGVQIEPVGLRNYQYILLEAKSTQDVTENLSKVFINAILDTFLDVPFILIFSLVMAVVLNSNFKGRAFVRAIFFMPVIFNSQAINMVLSSFGDSLDQVITSSTTELFDSMFNMQEFMMNAGIPPKFVTYLGSFTTIIYDIISYSGVQILIFLSAIQSVPKHLYEAAKMEGATQYEIFWKITFPMVSPMLITTGVYTVVDSFMRSSLIKEMNYYINNKSDIKSAIYGTLSAYGVNAAISMIFALIAVLIIIVVVLLLSGMVFYYDE